MGGNPPNKLIVSSLVVMDRLAWLEWLQVSSAASTDIAEDTADR